MSDLVAFLLARIDEEEAVARTASITGPHWVQRRSDVDDEPTGAVEADDGTDFGPTIVYDEGSPTPAEAAHIARWDPARVLAECEAKRRIVTEGDAWFDGADEHYRVLRLLAQPYRDHPDFDPAWAL